MFKIGDKVLVKYIKSSASKIFNGKICTISRVNFELGGYGFYNLKEETSHTGIWPDELERVNEPARKQYELRLGDKVEFLTDYKPFKKGNKAKVIGLKGCYYISGNQLVKFDDLNGKIIECFAKRVKLVKENNMTKLEELVKKANEASDILTQLYKHPDIDKVEFGFGESGKKVSVREIFHTHCPSVLVTKDHEDVFFIKKKEFIKFHVGKGRWEVSVDGEFCHIGCQKFDLKKLKIFLNGAINGQTPQGQGFNCSKIGLYHTSTNNWLTWEDAEKILKALEDHA